jgi:hypothetical protein
MYSEDEGALNKAKRVGQMQVSKCNCSLFNYYCLAIDVWLCWHAGTAARFFFFIKVVLWPNALVAIPMAPSLHLPVGPSI